MVTEIQRYRARLFQVFGFSCMAPLGKLILLILDPKSLDLTIKFVIVLLISIILAFLGIIFLLKGEEHLQSTRHR